MKKIIFSLCFFILHLGAQEFKFIDANISKEDEGIYALVEKYVDLNNQIKEFKKNNDENSSTFNGILSEFEKDKKTILAKIPDMIVGQKINEEAVARFLKAKEKLLDVQKKNINKPYIYTDATLNLVYFNIVESFYSSLFEVEKLFKNTASSEDLIATVDKAMENLQNSSNVNLDSFKSKITNPEELEKITLKERYISNAVDSYSEILKYLRSNADLLESNYIFSLLELQVWIDRINEAIGVSFVNIGKIVISALVLVFFISLRRFFANIVYFFLVQLFYRNKNDVD
ncbi:mechanosensitive ion channel family protein, partial [Campylobacter jejuni]|nr:mechanosensitive ion channel family protein [Campylobacter jejuni]EGC6690853.1 mechanosensitive ion channel family protein [Campylobacter jejuni]